MNLPNGYNDYCPVCDQCVWISTVGRHYIGTHRVDGEECPASRMLVSMSESALDNERLHVQRRIDRMGQ